MRKFSGDSFTEYAGIISGIDVEGTVAGQMPDGITDGVEEPAVMADDDNAALIFLEGLFYRFSCIGIQVVGWLVQQ